MADKPIITYTKEDFLDGTEPYEEVYKYIDDQFEMDRAIEKMSAVAKLVGVKNFKTLFKGYCKKMNKISGGNVADNATNFEDQPLELNTGVWKADEYGITKETPLGTVMACVHPIMPVQRLVNVDSSLEKTELAYRKGNDPWKKIICEKKTLASSNAIIALSDYGVAVTSENSRYLVQYLHDAENLNYDLIPERRSVGRLGWISEGQFSPYVDDLIFDGDVSFKHFFESVKEHGSFEEWKGVMIQSIRSKEDVPARIVLAASFASVLVEPLHVLPFFVHLWGGSGSGKTVALMAAASVWADPTMGRYIHTFNSTSVGQELSAGFVNSMPLIMDELQIVKDKKDFDKTIYSLAEGVGRVRGAKTGGLQKTLTWANCILTTGEQPISTDKSGGGAINRIIEICCEGLKLFDDPISLVAQMKQNYGFAGKRFVELLTPDVLDTLKKEYSKTYKAMLDKATEKQAASAALILVADQLATKLIFKDDNALDAASIERFLATQQDIDQNVKAFEWLATWLAQNSAHFIDDDDSDYVPQDIWGRIDGGNYNIMKTLFDSACREAGFNPTAFLSWLCRLQLVTHNKNRNTKVVDINGIKARCVSIRRNAIEVGNQPFVDIVFYNNGEIQMWQELEEEVN